MHDNPPLCIILAAGRGTRMRSKTMHKACFPIAGRPAILRVMDAFTQAGVNRFAVVVGAMAGQVVETVGAEYPDAMFVYQPQQLGTGNATRIGVMPLQSIGYNDPVIVTMGDKLIDPKAVTQLLTSFTNENADATVGVLPRLVGSAGGRVLVRNDGSFAGIVETRDIQKAAILEKTLQVINTTQAETATALDSLVEQVEATMPDPTKRRIALGVVDEALQKKDLLALAEAYKTMGPDPYLLSLGQSRFTVAQANEAQFRNAALYIFKAAALYEGLRWLTTDNAQKEEYLTDGVNYLANALTAQGTPAYRVNHCLLDPADILTYNNPEELLVVEEQYRQRLAQVSISEPKLPAGSYRSVHSWLSLLNAGGPGLEALMTDIYGRDQNLWQERIAAYKQALTTFAQRFGTDRKVILVRAPGRVNLMGRHIEHRGGNVNVMAINKETVLVAATRDDDLVRISNTQSEHYPDAQFSIGTEVADLPWHDWLDYINNDHVQGLVRESKGNWVNYVKAAFLRLQFQFRDVRIRGIDAVVTGNIPVAAGLSSSSSIVVAAAEAAAALNGMEVTPQDFVDLCGEGEWYVGSRGGAGDHAAMKFSRRGYLTQIGFFPFGVKGSVPFPADYRLVVANSHIKAQKMTNAKDTFNQRVASYEFGLMLLKKAFPRLAPHMVRLRDVNSNTLNLRPSEIYEMLLSLPETMSRSEIVKQCASDNGEALERIFSSHNEPETYLLRSVVLYGVAECSRAEMCRTLLEQGDVSALGQLMLISHDGDRVAKYTSDGKVLQQQPYNYMAPEAYLQNLIANLRSEDPARVAAAQLHKQPGGYACSTTEIDFIVDTVKQIPGVVGAQLSGAGLGGCVMILVRQDAVESLQRVLTEQYYQPNKLQPDITVCSPVKGSGLISVG
jgi:N-acetylgalactosamine kinase